MRELLRAVNRFQIEVLGLETKYACKITAVFY